MKVYYLILAVMISPLVGMSQVVEATESKEEVYTIVERMPEFPGGNKAMFEFLGNNIEYPPKAKAKNIQGKVYVNFTISKDGTIRDVKVLRKAHKLLDAEAVRVIKIMPDWIPGMQRGEMVSVSYNLPINFSLTGRKKKNKK
ncbi:MAG: energy transducer TonB [Flavobacteriales bacterium]|nr:MAG: energy transducer TonB [Flavobacteriales bacterium]